MVYARLQRTLLSGPSFTDITCASRGGIILSAAFQNVPNAYWDVNTASESPRQGDLQVYVTDMSTLTTPFGQATANNSYINIPVNGTWRWENPFARELLGASEVISKFSVDPAIIVQTPGIFTGAGLRFFVSPDPILNVQHKLQVELELIIFDPNAS